MELQKILQHKQMCKLCIVLMIMYDVYLYSEKFYHVCHVFRKAASAIAEKANVRSNRSIVTLP